MYEIFLSSEAVVQMCSVKNVFLKMLKNYEENTCATGAHLKSSNFIKNNSSTGVF